MAPWRVALGIAIVGVLAVVTGVVLMSSFGDEPSVASTPIAPAPTATATASATVDPDPMPELHNMGEDFDKIIRSIEAYRNWLYRNPNPELVRHIYAEECPCYEGVRERLRRLVDDGVRFAQSETVIHEVSVLQQDPDAVALRVVDEGRPSIVVSAESGEVVDRDEGTERRTYRFLLIRRGEHWLVRDIRAASADLGSDHGTS